MRLSWKKVKNEDGSEMLFGAFQAARLEEACAKASRAAAIITSHRRDNYSHMSLSNGGLAIALHGASKTLITDDDWAIADEIQKALSV